MRYRRTEVNAPTYSLDLDDFVGIIYDGPVILTLPEIEEVGEICYTIIDESGTASSNNITIVCSGSDLIRHNISMVIQNDYGYLRIYNDGGNNWFLC